MVNMRHNQKTSLLILLVVLALCGVMYRLFLTVNTPGQQYQPDWAEDNKVNIVFLFLIKSYPQNIELRKAIRETWGTYIASEYNSKTLFYMGKSLNMEINSKVTEESLHYKDIIQGNFIDSFYNQSLCTLNAFKYILHTFGRVKYLFKVEDSTFVNVPRLVRILNDNKEHLHHFIMGRVTKETKPDRNKDSLFYVTKDAYPQDFYPPYAQSFAYLMSGHLISKLVEESAKVPFLWIEDVYVTGVLANHLNITYLNNMKFGTPENKCVMQNYATIPDKNTPEEMKRTYISVEIPNGNCDSGV